MEQNLYESIATRTGGNIYIGVVGPVRTGKSTFIKSFMETLVLPNISDMYVKERARDELPQCGSGRTIMTAEPKFVPEEAVHLTLDGDAGFNVRLVDCVGYMVDGAIGQYENDAPRMVTTPWFDYEIPLAEAAEIGTRKVITDHSTIGLVVTTDGTIGELERAAYVPAEERIVRELQEINKPFCIVLNSAIPQAQTTQELRAKLEQKYGVSCVAANCQTLQAVELEGILSTVLYEFPVKEYYFTVPEWLSAMPAGSLLRDTVYQKVCAACGDIRRMRDARTAVTALSGNEPIESAALQALELGMGRVRAMLTLPRALFYQMLSEQSGMTVTSEGELLPMLCEMARVKREYDRLAGALEQVRATGYGIVMPTIGEMHLEQPEIVKQGGRYGVRLQASAPSIHMILTNVETEICPIVGSERQSEELVNYLMSEFEDSPERLWQSNIFGKSLSELVNEGLIQKLYKMPEDARCKLQETLERIINEGSGGLICIIL
ncbi:MAG: stage IV sporulation protein A [Clostridiaceae bacterium]|nr:stage IV sporulation protein A [Clostridiaceae bacterium]